VIKQALLKSSGDVLLAAFLPPLAPTSSPSTSVPPREDGALSGLEGFIRSQLSKETTDYYAQTHRHVDKILLSVVLDFTCGHYGQAARILGISRQTLRIKLRALGVHVTHAIETDEDTATN